MNQSILSPQQFADALKSTGWTPSQMNTSPTQTQADAITKIDPTAGASYQKIVSSATPVLNNNTKTGLVTGGNALNGNQDKKEQTNLSGFNDTQMQSLLDMIKGAKDTQNTTSQNALNRGISALDAVYNANLASSNAMYSNAMQDLKTSHAKQTSVANAMIARADPYGVNSSSASQGMLNQIDTDYQNQARKIEQQASLAQQQLAAGNYQAYTSLVSAIEKDQTTFNTNMQDKAMEMFKWGTQLGIQQSQFAEGQKNIWADNFKQQLESISYKPEQIDAMIKDGSILDDPTYQAGIKAGYSSAGVVDSMRTGTIKAQTLALNTQKALDMEEYRNAQLARQTSILDRQSRVQNTKANILAYETENKEKYGTPEYLSGIISNSAGGGDLPSTAATSLSGTDAVLARMDRLADTMKQLDGSDPLVNMVASKLPWSEKVAKYSGQIASLATGLARNVYGEKGTISDKDIERYTQSLGGTATVSDVRNALVKGVTQDILAQYEGQLKTYAELGYDVSPFSVTYNQTVNKVNALQAKIGNTTNTNSASSIDVNSIVNNAFK